jgi:hypothetical protein
MMPKSAAAAIVALFVCSNAIPAGLSGEVGGNAPSGERKARIAAIVGEVFSATETREAMRVLCDEIGGRVTGTRAGREAREFGERLLNRYGLENVHQEVFELQGWERGPFHLEVTAPRAMMMHAVALANTQSTPPGGVEAPVVDVGRGYPEELDRLGGELRGSFALVTAGSLPGRRWMHRSEVMAVVAERGAAGLLYQTTRPGSLPMTGMCWENGLSPIPGAGISLEDGEWIKRRLAAGNEVRVRLAMTNLTGPAKSANVIGEIQGRTNEFVIIGAHLDSWDLGQGAVDNGTGAVVLLEAARALSALGVRPQATIRFILFMGEELGLAGARAYAAAHRDELSRCRAMINCDMTGTPLGIRLMGHEYANPFFEELLGSLDGFELTAGVSNRPGIYGDHQPFFLRGVPVLSPRSRLEDESWQYYHTSADTYDKLTFKQLDLEAAFVAVLALELAATEKPVMRRLAEQEIDELIERHDLGESLRFWGDWHGGR